MPIDMTVKEPWARVVCLEADDGSIILELPQFDYIATDWIFVVIFVGPGTTDYGEGMLERVGERGISRIHLKLA